MDPGEDEPHQAAELHDDEADHLVVVVPLDEAADEVRARDEDHRGQGDHLVQDEERKVAPRNIPDDVKANDRVDQAAAEDGREPLRGRGLPQPVARQARFVQVGTLHACWTFLDEAK